MNRVSLSKNQGQAVLVSVTLLALLALVVISGAALPIARQGLTARQLVDSRLSYLAAESGVEDAAYRIKNNLNVPASYNFTLNNVETTIIVSEDNDQRIVSATGNYRERYRSVSASLSLNTNEVEFFYGIQVGDGGLKMDNNARVEGNVYSNGNVIGSNGAVITGTAVVAGGISSVPSLEWTDNDSDQFFATQDSNRDIAQSFVATESGRFNRLTVLLGKVGNPTNSLTFRVHADNGGKPSTSSLTSAVVPASNVGQTLSWVAVSFFSPPTLSAGSRYWIVIDTSSSSGVNYWNWRKDATDSYTNNTGKYTNDCCSGSPVWSDVGGDLAFQLWVGGTNTKIENMVIGDANSGLAQANLFVNTTVHGSTCPNQYCIVDNPPREELPISAGVIQDWRDAAAAGGECAPPVCDEAGNYVLTNSEVGSLGPIHIPGTFTIDNNSTLTITGTIWVSGDIQLSNTCIVRLDSGYGVNSGVILGDDDITVSNNCTFSGSGEEGSYMMLLSDKNNPGGTVITVDNNAVGVIYYASRGDIYFSNRTTAKEATAYGIRMSNNSTITYESGLADLIFSSGPGASFDITSWQEV